MPRTSAGILLFRRRAAGLEVLLVHMGGPFWAARDDGAWSLPKGEHGPEEDPLVAARREFAEELGSAAPSSEPLPLGTIRQSGGKVVSAFALEGDFDCDSVSSNTFEIEWPRGSGRTVAFPEVDRAGWFGLEDARRKLIGGQVPFIDSLLEALARTS